MRRNRGQAAQRGELARGRRRPRGQARVLRMAHDQRAQRPGIGQGARQDLGVLDHMIAVGKGHRPGIEQKADLGHLAPCAALGQGGHVADADGRFGRAAGDEFQRLGRVDGGVGVGPRDDGGDAPRRRRKTGRAEAFLVPLARFADLDAEGRRCRGRGIAAAVDDRRALGGRPSRAAIRPFSTVRLPSSSVRASGSIRRALMKCRIMSCLSCLYLSDELIDRSSIGDAFKADRGTGGGEAVGRRSPGMMTQRLSDFLARPRSQPCSLPAGSDSCRTATASSPRGRQRPARVAEPSSPRACGAGMVASESPASIRKTSRSSPTAQASDQPPIQNPRPTKCARQPAPVPTSTEIRKDPETAEDSQPSAGMGRWGISTASPGCRWRPSGWLRGVPGQHLLFTCCQAVTACQQAMRPCRRRHLFLRR